MKVYAWLIDWLIEFTVGVIAHGGWFPGESKKQCKGAVNNFRVTLV